jgi:two-component system response regulator FlrC
MPFVPLNCSAIPEQLVESILFGHVKGSFTGAVKDQVGIFEEANGGTLFLDEVGELPLHIQPKLLRALQERKVVRVGSSKERGFNVRLVAATNKDLSRMVASGSFREDLFYRLNAFHVGIPELSKRPLDVKELAIKLAANHEMAGIKMEITEAAVDRLLEHSWPGNIRELENVICRAKVLALDGLIDVQHILFDAMNFSEVEADIEAKSSEREMAPFQMVRSEQLTSPKSKLRRLDEARDSTELDVIESAIREAGSKKEAAQRLGISPRTLRHKLQRLKQSQSDKQPVLGYK